MFDDGIESAFAETIVWKQDKPPHLSGTFRGEVLRGTVDATSAGVPLGPVTADIWRVHIPTAYAIAMRIVMGDTIELPDRPRPVFSPSGANLANRPDSRTSSSAVTLSVQSVIADDSGVWLNCTAAERAPV